MIEFQGWINVFPKAVRISPLPFHHGPLGVCWSLGHDCTQNLPSQRLLFSSSSVAGRFIITIVENRSLSSYPFPVLSFFYIAGNSAPNIP